MIKRFTRILWVCLTLSLAAAPAARAQWAVVDVGAITQLMQEVRTMSQQLITAQAQLQQARDHAAVDVGRTRHADALERHQSQLPPDQLRTAHQRDAGRRLVSRADASTYAMR